MRVVFAGTPDVAVPSLAALADSGHELLAVVTRPDAQTGRGRRLTPSPVKQWALDHGISVLTPAKPSDPEFAAQLAALAPDCCPVVAYGALLPTSVLTIPTHGWVNLHFSVLPAWRGAAPVQHAVWRGDTETGATVFQIVKELDAGPAYGHLTVDIGPRDTAGDLLERLSHLGARLLVDVLDGIQAGVLQAIPQPVDGASYAPKIVTTDARVTWTQPAFAIDRQVRACTPAPGAWTTFRGERLGLAGALPLAEATLAPGEIAATKHEVRVGTATNDVVLETVKPPGKRWMSGVDWARGARLESGETLQ